MILKRREMSVSLKWNLLLFMGTSVSGVVASLFFDFANLDANGRSLLKDARLIVSGMILSVAISTLLSGEISRVKKKKL